MKFPRRRWTLLGILVVALAAGAVYLVRSRDEVPDQRTVAYTSLLAAMGAGKVDSIRVQPGSSIDAWFKTEGRQPVRVVYSSTDVEGLMKAAQTANVGVSFESRPSNYQALTGLIVSVVFLIVGIYLIRRQMVGVTGTPAGERGTSTLTFKDVAGNSAALYDLKEIVEFLRHPDKFATMGARTPKGLLLEGPPGTGKTLMARALAGEAGVAFFAASGSDFTGTFVGQGVSRVKGLFKKARKAGRAVIFIDEIDTLGGRRGRQQGHNEDDRTLNQFLVELDGFDQSCGVVVVGATNRSGDLDPALLRKGRFDRSVNVGLPTVSEREEILGLHVRDRKVPLAADVDLTRLARLMMGSSGAELAGLINEAAILAVRGKSPVVTWAHIEEARDRILLGRAREGLSVSDVERRLVALHEAGHALCGVQFCPVDPLHKVTIQPRGGAMGVAFFQPDHETHISSRQYMEGQILKGLGGRAAEEIAYGTARITSGAASDLQHTTRLAKHMVYRLGMGETTGLIVFDPDSGPVSSETHTRMDADVRQILEISYSTVLAFLKQNRAALDALADALLVHETLTGEEAIAIMEAAGLRRSPLPH